MQNLTPTETIIVIILFIIFLILYFLFIPYFAFGWVNQFCPTDQDFFEQLQTEFPNTKFLNRIRYKILLYLDKKFFG